MLVLEMLQCLEHLYALGVRMFARQSCLNPELCLKEAVMTNFIV
jgi:hypothetical protein